MINIVCALHCEAKPLITHYRLSNVVDAVYPTFEKQNIRLVVSGVGRVSMASAMGYVFAKYGEIKNQAWLNYGIAGHKVSALGTWYNVNKIREVATDQCWYPSRFSKNSMDTSGLKTVDLPVSEYAAGQLYDMEAAAFMATALKFSSVELVQVLKLVSDNEISHVNNINKKQVQALFDGNIDGLVAMISVLQVKADAFSAIYSEDALFVDCLSQWHFSEYQKKALERLIQRWRSFEDVKSQETLFQCQNAKQVMLWFETRLNEVSVEF